MLDTRAREPGKAHGIMKIVGIREAKHWKNARTGRTASIYGAVPYTSAAESADWQIVTSGYTWELDNGTVGFGRKPASTREEAEEVMRAFNARR